jgi:hypothetical protein
MHDDMYPKFCNMCDFLETYYEELEDGWCFRCNYKYNHDRILPYGEDKCPYEELE